jgi:hypothetical protein
MLYTKPQPGFPVVLALGDKELELRYTLKTLKELDEKHHISVLKGEGLGDTLRDPAQLAVVLYYGVKSRHPELTQDWIEDNVDAAMLLDLAPALAYSITGRWPDMEKILANLLPNVERPADNSQTGSPSGPLAATISGYQN